MRRKLHKHSEQVLVGNVNSKQTSHSGTLVDSPIFASEWKYWITNSLLARLNDKAEIITFEYNQIKSAISEIAK